MALPGIAPYPLPAPGDLPTPRAPFRPERDRLALLVHDMQRYFCRPYPEDTPLLPLVANIARLIGAARAAGVPVFWTAQKGDQFRPDRGLQADLWGPGMSAIPEHEEILPALAPRADEIVLHKHRYSAFQRSNLEHLMRARGRDQLMITGIYAHIGCLCTATEAFQRDIEPFAVADAQADFDRARHDMAMNWVAATCGGVLSTDMAAEALA
ncbi:isochorismatase family protein [Pseudooceanicola sp. CBS1P-1]|uniref:Isochorismatase family protein n=1 Tax=Pseudooceanicola albus TaxID=2692189 RepID=A0A6L7G4E3_9RHOB|nr:MULTISPECIES: isochorismatase family protein [Pseudooceanicola]MBT9385280.1 isochorismatase family protein [Pseudooceanicola endophyticus]MXN18861.1 isochorismatase family protein [Pseudooceanicola albus]